LIPQILKAGIPMGVATLSPQEELICEMLGLAFTESVVLNENCFVRGSKPGESRHHSVHEGLNCSAADEETGKRKHIADILTRVPGGCDITPQEVLFIDDDIDNISCARKDGYRVVRFLSEISDQEFMRSCFGSLQ